MKREALLSVLLYVSLFADVQIGGKIQSYQRMRLNDSLRWTWNEDKFYLNIDASPSDNLHSYTELEFTLKDRTGNYELKINEAYFEIYDFLIPGFDLKLGKQVVSWGAADKINPTSLISPYNFEDFFNMGDKEGIVDFQLSYNPEILSVEADIVPFFNPWVLPPEEYLSALTGMPPAEQTQPVDSELGAMNTQEITYMTSKPSKTVEFGFKAAKTIKTVDLSVSYFRGRFGLPFPYHTLIIPIDSFTNQTQVFLTYPKIHVFGLNFSTSLKGIGFWGEFAYYKPDKFIDTVEVQTITPQIKYDTLFDKGFFKFVIGGDYNFKNGLYINVQFIRGFLHELGDTTLHNYVAFRLEKNLFNDRIKLAPFDMLLTWKDKNNYGFTYAPNVSLMPYDNVELKFGFGYTHGKGDNFFARMDKWQEVYVKFIAEF